MKGLSLIFTLLLMVSAAYLAQRLKQAGLLPVDQARPVASAVLDDGHSALLTKRSTH